MKKILHKLESTFDTTTKGYSSRKLSAFWAIVIMGGLITYKYVDVTNAVEMLTAWLIFGLLCLGIITVQNIINFKNGTTSNNSSDNGELQGDKDKPTE
jgi:hypothetical protein